MDAKRKSVKIFYRFIPFFIIFFATAFLSFLNLGKFLDDHDPYQKAEIIVSLGGDHTGDRIKRAYELYRNGYSQSGKIIINPPFDAHAVKYLTEHNVTGEHIVFMSHATNTVTELRFVKNFLLNHHMHKVIIVSDPPHLRRIRFLANSIEKFPKYGLQCTLIGSSPLWWNTDHWYRQGYALAFAFSEIVKFPIDYVKYAILERYGLLEPFREHCKPCLSRLRRVYKKIFMELWKIYL